MSNPQSFRKTAKFFAVIVALCVSSVACGPTPTAPSQFAAYSQTDLQIGTGDEAVSGLTIGVRYTLWLYDSSKLANKGLQLESSAGGDPFSFQLGANQVIEGWERGVPGMRVGGRRRLIVPPDLAYGDTRIGPIPANATLVFDIELASVTAQQQ
ncbi:MAG: FKBP-type peptidyl-prolyl cis-trans isomerase [Longimicrobiales bacterium]